VLAAAVNRAVVAGRPTRVKTVREFIPSNVSRVGYTVVFYWKQSPPSVIQCHFTGQGNCDKFVS